MPDRWTYAPGDTRGSGKARSTIRKLLGSLIVGMVSISVAWAGAGLVPAGLQGAETKIPESPVAPEGEGAEAILEGKRSASVARSRPSQGEILAGAAKVSLEPRPKDYEGKWETDYDKCATLSDNPDGVQEGAMHVANLRVRWAENPNCIYMGGYGLGPMNPIVKWDDKYGLWARSVALSDGKDAVVLTLIDAVYWEAYYDSLCDGCGFLELAESLAKKTGFKAESFIFASTHSHTSPDFIGGWGGVPDWYMKQATDALRTSVLDAVRSMKPAVLEAGEVVARGYNGERRDFYRSAEDDGMSWFRVLDAHDNRRGRAIATVGAYAAHPVTVDPDGTADADFPGVFAQRVEERFGGVAMFLQTGLGNLSPRGSKVEMGSGLASLVPAIGDGERVNDPDITVGRTSWDQPVTNVPLGALGVTGFFDRRFNQTPAAVHEGKGPENRKCTSASPVSVDTSVTAAKIGSLWITGGPGELFANLSNTIEESNPNGVTLALGLVNDGLGYIIQSFETDHVGRQGTGFVGEAGPVGVAEYEDAYSIDHCFGDAVLEKTLGLLGTLR